MAKVVDSTLRLIDQFSPILRQVNQSIGNTKGAMDAATSSTEKMSNAIKNHTSSFAQFEKVNNRIAKSVNGLGNQLMNIGKSMPVVALTGAATAGYYLSQSLDKAINRIQAIGNMTAEQTARMRKDLIALSNDTGVGVTTIAEATQKAAAGGISAADSMKFMAEAIKMSKVADQDLNSTVAQTLSFYKSYGMQVGDVSKLNDQLVVTARLAQAELKQVAPALAGVANSANDAGVSVAEMSAAYVMMVRKGNDATASAASLNTLFDSFAKASPKAVKAAQEFGIELNQAHIKSVGFPAFLQEIMDKTGGDEQAIGKIIKDVEAFKLAFAMTGDKAQFTAFMKEIQNSTGATGAALEKLATPSAKLNKAFNQLKNAGMELGAALAPLVLQLANTITKVVDSFNKMDESEKQTVLNIMKSVIVFGAASLAVGKFLTTIGGGIKTIIGLHKSFKDVSDAVKGARDTFSTLPSVFSMIGKAASFLMANPIILVVAAIIAVGYLLYKNWDTVKEHLGIAWAAVVGFFKGAYENISIIVNGIVTVITGIIDFVTNVFMAAWSAAWSAVVGVFTSIFSSISGVCSSVLEGIKAAINAVIGGINSISVNIPSWVPKFGGNTFSLNIPYLAHGTEDWPGGQAVIHDQGAEIVDLPSGTRVIPHDKSLNEAYNNGHQEAVKHTVGDISVNISNVNVTGEQDIKKLARKIAAEIYSEMQQRSINLNEGAI